MSGGLVFAGSTGKTGELTRARFAVMSLGIAAFARIGAGAYVDLDDRVAGNGARAFAAGA